MSIHDGTYDASIMSEEHQATRDVMRYAGFWMRFWAYLADLLVIAGLSTLLIGPINLLIDLREITIGFWTTAGVLGSVIFYAYFLLMTRYFGQTLGKMIFGLRVISTNGGRPAWGDLIFREVIGRFIYRVFLVMHVLYIVVAFTKNKDGLHDMVANTHVIYERHR
ncbi:putative membrane protein YteJ [Lentibacillus sp. JNUCC-1]|nr:putative membrane protein YteJ [Lentibacillus sp. JNUCC-1]